MGTLYSECFVFLLCFGFPCVHMCVHACWGVDVDENYGTDISMMLCLSGPNKSDENSEETILAANIQGPTCLVPCLPCSALYQGFHSSFLKHFS